MITLLELVNGEPVLVNFSNVDFIRSTDYGSSKIYFNSTRDTESFSFIVVKESMDDIYKRTK